MLIVLEGIDGSGKGTQAALLVESLRLAGRTVAALGFPRYRDTFFGARIGDFLNGRFGALNEVDPFLAAVLFAGDRQESRPLLERLLHEHDDVVLDRYVASNMAHQSAKCAEPRRTELLRWVEQLEFDVHRLPRPDRTVYLDLAAPLARQLIEMKSPRDYTAAAVDLQEANLEYQAAVRDVYRELSSREPRWRTVEVASGGMLRSIDEIAVDVWRAVHG